MLHLGKMHFVHSIWTKPMGGKWKRWRTQWFPWITLLLSAMGNRRRWWLTQASQRACSRCLRSVGLMFAWCVRSAPQSACLKIPIVAWLGSSANRTISETKYHSSRRKFACAVISVFSFPNSIVSSIPLKWFVQNSFILILSTEHSIYSTGDGSNIGTETSIRTDLMRQRKSCRNASTHAPLTSSGGSSIRLGVSWTLIGKGWLEGQRNGRSDSRNRTEGLDKQQWCPWKLFLIRFNQNKTHYIVKFGPGDCPPPKKCGKNKKRVFLDVFSPPKNDSGVCFPVKNLFPTLENWWTFAVRHCSANRHCCLIAAQYNRYKHRSINRWIFCYHILDNNDISRGTAVSEGTNCLSLSPVTRHYILEVIDSIKILIVWHIIKFTCKVRIQDHVLYKDSGVIEINLGFIIHPLQL